jgi:SAM-dependent methyltransferase
MSREESKLKDFVKEKYGEIAKHSDPGKQPSCCAPSGCCDTIDYSVFSDDYSLIEGYDPEADLGLGCGIPTEFADIRPGDSILDLGSGAGNDCFVARAIVGEQGRVTGVDFTDAMIEKASANARKLGFSNVEFIKGDIEDLPFPDSSFNVVISNCVLNLVPDKNKAFREIYRVLKPGGHFSVSDVVLSGDLPEGLRNDAEMYAGCVSGASQKEEYIKIISEAGFENILVNKEKQIIIPNAILLKYISLEELRIMKRKKAGIFSITLTAARK